MYEVGTAQSIVRIQSTWNRGQGPSPSMRRKHVLTGILGPVWWALSCQKPESSGDSEKLETGEISSSSSGPGPGALNCTQWMLRALSKRQAAHSTDCETCRMQICMEYANEIRVSRSGDLWSETLSVKRVLPRHGRPEPRPPRPQRAGADQQRQVAAAAAAAGGRELQPPPRVSRHLPPGG